MCMHSCARVSSAFHAFVECEDSVAVAAGGGWEEKLGSR